MKYTKILPYLLPVAVSVTAANSSVPGQEDNDQEKKYIAMANNKDVVNHISTTIIGKYAISAAANGKSVIYTNNCGGTVERTGGTRAWRNNNPGCLRYGPRAQALGAIGHAGGFAVFPDEETGRFAIMELLLSDSYKNLMIAQAISKYAPPRENNTAAYKRRLAQKTGLAMNLRICDLSQEQLEKVADAIAEIEGWVPGKITELKPDTIMPMQQFINLVSNQRQ